MHWNFSYAGPWLSYECPGVEIAAVRSSINMQSLGVSNLS